MQMYWSGKIQGSHKFYYTDKGNELYGIQACIYNKLCAIPLFANQMLYLCTILIDEITIKSPQMKLSSISLKNLRS